LYVFSSAFTWLDEYITVSTSFHDIIVLLMSGRTYSSKRSSVRDLKRWLVFFWSRLVLVLEDHSFHLKWT
jgi:hypothetical protein